MYVLKAVGALIKKDIFSMPVNKQNYPSTEVIQSAVEHVPKSNVFSKKDSDLQLYSIGQAIVQAARPR